MAFTASQAFDLLRTAFSRNRLPHALLIVGDEHQGASRLILQLLELINGIRADHLDSVRDEYCRLVRPKSKSRRILRDDIRAVEPFLQQRAAEGKWKIAVFMDAERMNDEAANAFLKTLEEPPGQCLLILSTSQPDQLLQTIISRCVRVNLLQSGEFRLTPIQEALLPHWLETCRNLNNDLAALAFRSRFMDVMAEAKAAITKNLNQALKDEAREAAQGTDASDWEARNKDANAAQIETEYLEQRNQALELLISWFGQAALIASGAPEVAPIHPEVRTLAAQMPVNELLKRMEALNRLRDDLNFNIHEIQEALLPHWLETCRNLNNDLAALAFRSRFMDVMAEAKAAITKNLNQALKDEAREAAQGTDASDWEARNKDANAAQIETEYLEQRNQALELLISWFGQAALIASGAPEVAPIHPEVRTLAAQMPVNELLKRMEALNRLRDDLNFNIHEALALDVHLLAAVGSC